MAVRSDLVKETMVETICSRVRARLEDEHLTPERAGYLARLVETELFAAARSPLPGLTDDSREAEVIARELASREPLDRPAPDDPDAVSWRVPGPGGHVRHYVAVRLLGRAELKRDFMYGFLMRCCEEAAGTD